MKSWSLGGSYPVRLLAMALIVPLVFFGCTACLISGIDGKYDNSHLYVTHIDRTLAGIAKSVYRVETTTRFKSGSQISTLRIVGMAFSLDHKHLLTAKHVTSIDNFQVQTPFGTLTLTISPEDKLEETTSIVFDDGTKMPTKIIYRDKDLDFAVLEAKNQVEPPPYAIGNSDDFRIANMVIIPSNFQTGLSIRMGYVTQLNFVRYGAKGEISERDENLFGVSVVISEGDSGSPILFFRDGKIELGGVVSFIVTKARGLGYGLKINPIMERLTKAPSAKGWMSNLTRSAR